MAYSEEVQGLEDEFHHLMAQYREIRLPGARKAGQYYAKIVNNRTLTDKDICMLMLERGQYKGDIQEMQRFLRHYHHEVCYQLCDGNAVNMGGNMVLGAHIEGSFTTLKEGRYDGLVTFTVRVLKPLADLAKRIVVYFTGLGGSGAAIYEIIDSETGLANKVLTKGGLFRILGYLVKIEGDPDKVGVSFVSEAAPGTPSVTVKARKVLAINTRGELVGPIPELPPGRKWRVEVRTQYSKGGIPLKEPRVIKLDCILDYVTGNE
jgi:hypothetical protein